MNVLIDQLSQSQVGGH